MDFLPRFIAIMGSGETSPSMVSTHQRLLARLGPKPIDAALLDTPYAFQLNRSSITRRLQDYFSTSVGQELKPASFPSDDARVPQEDEAEAEIRLRRAKYVFSGPGNATYMLRKLRNSLIEAVLREKLRSGGCLTVSSAAALAIGVATVPVHEIYRIGEDPFWMEGLDLLSEAGLQAAVIPHYNNTEGGTHDTRFGFLGERRLVIMETLLSGETFILGIDEHTCLILDLTEDTASVEGLGSVTVRRHGESLVISTGEQVPLDTVREFAGARFKKASPPGEVPLESPVMGRLVAKYEREFGNAGAPQTAVRVVLSLEDHLARAGASISETDRTMARSCLRSMIHRSAEMAGRATVDVSSEAAPFIEILMKCRTRARELRRWEEADAIRNELLALGIEVQDDIQGCGSQWTRADSHSSSSRSSGPKQQGPDEFPTAW